MNERPPSRGFRDTVPVSDQTDPVGRAKLLKLLQRQSEEAVRLAAVFGEVHGLHQTDVAALAVIAEATETGVPIGPGALSATLHLSPPATSALLDRLENAGHVIRRRDPDDRRRAILEIQPEASELASAFFGPLGAAFERAMDRYTPQDLKIIAAFLADMTDATIRTREQLDLGA